MSKPNSFGVGTGTLTILCDGTDRLPCEFFTPPPPRVDAQEAQSIEIPINAFLYQIDGRNILIDAGGAGLAPTLGALAHLLADMGISPAQIDTLFCTHLHPDHIGGLLHNGAPVFANAKMRIHNHEIDFWQNPAMRETAPPPFQALIDGACAVLTAYADQIEVFTDGEEIAPDAVAVHLPGHTPGHSGLQVGPSDTGILIWADIVHAATLQLAAPDTSILFDVDPVLAATTRCQLLSQLSDTDTRVVGGHLPGLERIRYTGEGYRLQT